MEYIYNNYVGFRFVFIFHADVMNAQHFLFSSFNFFFMLKLLLLLDKIKLRYKILEEKYIIHTSII
jgi:hypothetical protein